MNWHESHPKTNLDTMITPLCLAAFLGRVRIIQLMLDNFTYMDLNLETIDSYCPPISAACMGGNCEIVQLLAQNGADVNKPDVMHLSPLAYCFTRINEDCNHYENKVLALRMSGILLNYGANINQLSHGRTILMNFCR